MRTLLIACGNPLRSDDGVAPEVLQLIERSPDREMRAVQQLTPECAHEIAPFERVIFLDADAGVERVTIEPVRDATVSSSLTHAAAPGEIVALARALFGFLGEALVCRIPARDFSPGEGLTPDAATSKMQAAGELEQLL